MRRAGLPAQFDRQQYVPRRKPAVHQRERPLILGPLLDEACELCLLPIECPGWYDYGPAANYGTFVGGAWSSHGRYGPAVSFPIAGNRITLGAAANLNFTVEDFTIEMWVYLTSLAAAPTLFARYVWNTWGYRLEAGGIGWVGLRTFQAAANQITVSANGLLGVNDWYHIVGRRSGAAAEIFLNGVDVTLVPAVHINPVGNAGGPATVSTAGGFAMVGYTDLVRVYSRRLGDQEIADLYEQGRPGWL